VRLALARERAPSLSPPSSLVSGAVTIEHPHGPAAKIKIHGAHECLARGGEQQFSVASHGIICMRSLARSNCHTLEQSLVTLGNILIAFMPAAERSHCIFCARDL
jgi:hypothetical protein